MNALTKKHAFCLHDVRLNNIMLDASLQSVVLIDSANGCIKGPSGECSEDGRERTMVRHCPTAECSLPVPRAFCIRIPPPYTPLDTEVAS